MNIDDMNFIMQVLIIAAVCYAAGVITTMKWGDENEKPKKPL